MLLNKLVSVIMPVYNGEEYLESAIDSILNQSYSNFEFIIVNDGSTDKTKSIIESYNDDRISLFTIENGGLVNALNFGISKANGNYIARMDADDISFTNRFEHQVKVLEKNENVGVVCTNAIVIDNRDQKIGEEKYEIKSHSEFRDGLRYITPSKPIIHPSVMIRKEILNGVGGYRDFTCAEDLDLWLQLSRITKFFRIQEPLLYYRHNEKGVSQTKMSQQIASSLTAVLNYEIQEKYKVNLYNNNKELLRFYHNWFLNIVYNQSETANLFNNYKKTAKGHISYLKNTSFYNPNNIIKALNYYLNRTNFHRKTIEKAIQQLELYLKFKNSKQ